MFALSLALFALAMITALFGFHGAAATIVWLTCVVFAMVAMTAHWRNRDSH